MEIGERLLVGSVQEWREWLAAQGQTQKEIWLVLYKKAARQSGMTFDEALDAALCYGWVDNFLKGIDAETYALRFSPRRPKSNWSEGNRVRVARLLREGQMTERGLAALAPDMREDAT